MIVYSRYVTEPSFTWYTINQATGTVDPLTNKYHTFLFTTAY